MKRIGTNIKLLSTISLGYLCSLFTSSSQSMSLFKSDSSYKELKDAKIISDIDDVDEKNDMVTFNLNPLPKKMDS